MEDTRSRVDDRIVVVYPLVEVTLASLDEWLTESIEALQDNATNYVNSFNENN